MSSRKKNFFKGYDHQCVWCSCQLTSENASMDHVLCASAGGSNWKGNMLPSCQNCNIKRGDKTAQEWLVRCLKKGMKVKVKAVKAALHRVETDPRAHKVHFLEIGNANNRRAHYRALHIRQQRSRMLDSVNALLGVSAYHMEHVMTRHRCLDAEIVERFGIKSS